MQFVDKYKNLLDKISNAFLDVEMPQTEDLVIHGEECYVCARMRRDLDDVRGKQIDGSVIRIVYQDLSCLSAKSILWIFPHYLRYCLSAAGQKSRDETSFLVYNLSPSPEFAESTVERFGLFDQKQMGCVYDFLCWCSDHTYWGEYFPEDLARAKIFVNDLMNKL